MAIARSINAQIRGKFHVMTDYLVVTGNDTTTPVTGSTYSNRDGSVKRVAFTVVGKNKTGTSPTIQTTLQGSLDGTNWFTVLDSSGSAIQTTALSISSTDGTAANYATATIDTNQKGITSFPPFLRTSTAVGGTSSPGGTYDVMLQVERN